MADTIQLRAGNKENMPRLADREPAYVRDENALYVGTPDGNKKIGAELEAKVEELAEALETATESLQELEDNKLTATPAAAQADVASDAELAAVIAAFNSLIAALKASGLMSE